MISIVCIYNNEKTLRSILLKSLANQTVEHEIVAVNNSENTFKSASEAFNYGGAKANGDYIIFTYQNMWIGLETWLENTEKTLSSIPDLGIAGIAGVSASGQKVGKARLEEAINPVEKPELVQTLDECLLIVPKTVFGKIQFDEKIFDGWQCYGVDYCLSANRLGLTSFVIPAIDCHICSKQNDNNLLNYQRGIYIKHKNFFKHMYTCMGDISWFGLKLRSVRQFLGPFYLRVFPDLTITIAQELNGCKSLLDLGCGHDSPLQHCDIPFTVGVDLFAPSLQEGKRRGLRTEYIRADIMNIEFKPKSFDAVMAVEVIEHLTKEEGKKLLQKMEQWADKRIIVTTPNGYLWQDPYDNNPLQEHRSGWRPAELRELGFEVKGTNGWKRLRGYKTELKYKPTWLWLRISDLTQKVTYHLPYFAYQLFAVKRIN